MPRDRALAEAGKEEASIFIYFQRFPTDSVRSKEHVSSPYRFRDSPFPLCSTV